MRTSDASGSLALPSPVMVSAWCAQDRAVLGVVSQPCWAPALPFSPSGGGGGASSRPARAADGPGPSRGGNGPASQPSRGPVTLRTEEAVVGENQTQHPLWERLLTLQILRGRGCLSPASFGLGNPLPGTSVTSLLHLCPLSGSGQKLRVAFRLQRTVEVPECSAEAQGNPVTCGQKPTCSGDGQQS